MSVKPSQRESSLARNERGPVAGLGAALSGIGMLKRVRGQDSPGV